MGDILVLTKLAWNVYNVYKDAPDSFRNISDEIKSLHEVLCEVENYLQQLKLQGGASWSKEKHDRLQNILEGCTRVLNYLDSLFRKYQDVGSSTRARMPFWDRLRWIQEDISSLRQRLVSNMVILNTFLTRYAWLFSTCPPS